jgi:hypothetical protein
MTVSPGSAAINLALQGTPARFDCGNIMELAERFVVSDLDLAIEFYQGKLDIE